MSPQLREFVFSVDTDEVTGAIAPPAPVIATPRRRAAPPSVALRLPDLRTSVPQEPLSAQTAISQAYESPAAHVTAEPFVPRSTPSVSLPMMPRLPGADPLASLDDLARASVAQLIPVAAAAPTPDIPLAATAEPDAFWKSPKFMLAGVAAAFLGMVSLMAMNHEEQPAADEAPEWHAPSVTLSLPSANDESSALNTPRVTRGEREAEDKASRRLTDARDDEPPVARSAQLPPTASTWQGAVAGPTEPSQQEPWNDRNGGRERIVFDDEIDASEGTARIVPPLPNLATPAAREANHESAEPNGVNRY